MKVDWRGILAVVFIAAIFAAVVTLATRGYVDIVTAHPSAPEGGKET